MDSYSSPAAFFFGSSPPTCSKLVFFLYRRFYDASQSARKEWTRTSRVSSCAHWPADLWSTLSQHPQPLSLHPFIVSPSTLIPLFHRPSAFLVALWTPNRLPFSPQPLSLWTPLLQSDHPQPLHLPPGRLVCWSPPRSRNLHPRALPHLRLAHGDFTLVLSVEELPLAWPELCSFLPLWLRH